MAASFITSQCIEGFFAPRVDTKVEQRGFLCKFFNKKAKYLWFIHFIRVFVVFYQIDWV